MNALLSLLEAVVWFGAAILILVSIHELGHFWVARACGVKVLKFSVGFGPELISRRDKTGCVFAISAIPLGGYVKMLDEREGSVAAHEQHRSFNAQPPWQRILIALAGPMANFILAILVFAAVAIYGSYQLVPVVDEVAAGSLAERAGLQVDDRIVAVDGVAVESARDLQMHLLGRVGEDASLRLTVEPVDQAGVQRELSVELDSWLRDASEPDVLSEFGLGLLLPKATLQINQVSANSAAAQLGLLPGDILFALAGIEARSWEEFTREVRKRPGETVTLSYLRDGELMEDSVKLGVHQDESGKAIGLLGVSPVVEPLPPEFLVRKQSSVLNSIPAGFDETINTAHFVLLSMKKLIFGEISVKNLSGPIGIAKVAGDSGKAGYIAFLNFIGMLSVYLCVLNLLPIPVLDGGHILYGLVEWAKGSPVSDRVQIAFQQIGLLLLFGLMMLAIYYDVLRLI